MENQRIRLSKSMLRSALLQLLEEKTLNKISIHEICHTAQINRTTFYKYYGSQQDLLDDIKTEFLKQLNQNMAPVVALNQDAPRIFLNHLLEDRKTFCVLYKTLPTQDFCRDLFSQENFEKAFQNIVVSSEIPESQSKYLHQFVNQGIFAVLYSWLSSDQPEPVAEVTQVFSLIREKFKH